ncbi:hypothetical protein Rmf_42810 [Roseomonas fluvialis]|uniref:HTH araC/xylS-type domain-containing protein n=2 Tax=Roseomonas fluvialis TaxID=1750527 RepID=A0ABM7Y8N3_9PROT|nr:hypothetical protein Rmf_42810 [Roseomonas fluvialis]
MMNGLRSHKPRLASPDQEIEMHAAIPPVAAAAYVPRGFNAAVELGRLQKVLEQVQARRLVHAPALMDAVLPAIVALEGILSAALPARQEQLAGLAPWQRRKVAQMVEEHLHGPLAVSDMAATARLSRSAFTRAFTASFGQPPHSYVVGRRIARAQDLMVTTNEPLAQIALACGLADQAHLSRVFRQRIGTTPRSWRRTASAADMAA